MFRLYRSLPSAADILNRNGGEGPGFNAMRLILSLTILAVHSGWVAGADTSRDWEGLHGIFLMSLVPAFFALSGFLVTGSAMRTDAVRPFITLRAIRIVPALFVEITLSALVLGPLLTTWLLRDYVADIRFGSISAISSGASASNCRACSRAIPSRAWSTRTSGPSSRNSTATS